jgi:plasmid maintenance system antidote protein VapI
MSRVETHVYVLNAFRVDQLLEEHHLTHGEVALQLGYSRSYWSLLVNGHRGLSPKVRRCLRKHALLGSIAEDDLWTRSLRRLAA